MFELRSSVAAVAAALVLASADADAVEVFLARPDVAAGYDLRGGTRVDLFRLPPGKLSGDAVRDVRLLRVGTRGRDYGVYVDVPDGTPLTDPAGIGRFWKVIPRTRVDGGPVEEPGVVSEREAAAAAIATADAVAAAAAAAADKLHAALDAETTPDGFELTATHVRDPAPDDDGWRTLLREGEENSPMYRGWTPLRVFLERIDDESDGVGAEVAPVLTTSNTVLAFPFRQGPRTGPIAATSYAIRDGQFIGLRPYGRFTVTPVAPNFVERHEFRVLSLRHATAVVSVEGAFGRISCGGDVLLRRPPPAERADLVIRLADDSRSVGPLAVGVGADGLGGWLAGPIPFDGRGAAVWRDITARPLAISVRVGQTFTKLVPVETRPGRVTVATVSIDASEKRPTLRPPEIETYDRPGR